MMQQAQQAQFGVPQGYVQPQQMAYPRQPPQSMGYQGYNVQMPMAPHFAMMNPVVAMQQPQPAQETVRNVWRWNLEEQLAVMRDLVLRFNYISVDCKFPGIVARPIGTFRTTSEYHYQTLRSNVDILSVIQIGITLSDENGNRPVPSTWQFNFRFSANEDMCSSDGVELLRQSGINFAKHETEGIDPFAFGELLISSGLVLNPDVNWVTFHSGYDLGYLLSIMLNKEVPVEESGFLRTLCKYFPSMYDVKYIARSNALLRNPQKSSLLDAAEELSITLSPGLRGNNGLNQAGPDSILSDSVFHRLKKQMADMSQYNGRLFGLGDSLGDDSKEDDRSKQFGSASSANAASVFQFGKMGGGP
ncbi:poly(A) ribonuclease Pop2p [Trichomonascus vanleenenianus]|uniref:CCR4-NOT core DEDD family RNase subunit POP2 n=1 Tax=Trichomonascus vanleenenianus TaxID=2268995 RepID=UPI003ECB8F55